MRFFISLFILLLSCKGGQRIPSPSLQESTSEPRWEKKNGRPERPMWKPAYEVYASEIRGDKLRQILEDPNNNSLPKGESKSLLDSDLGWNPGGKRIFFIRIHPNSMYREIDTLGEVGIRLGDCDSKDKLEFPYTYYVFPTELGKGRDRVPKYLQENDKSVSSRKRKNYSHYLEETRRVLVAFPSSCFSAGQNRLEVQLLGEELYSFPFIFDYD
ncbi:hypothetical protein CH371_13535 [Leptospira wolffii]|uniref:Uncharacterized protein n=2 Tax=Leptospira wolffii TaxID=409998 RepID=A0A2M9ZAG4_9LEPT|nr:hypothetical protein CH371_13535 [Leptospira wolffii]